MDLTSSDDRLVSVDDDNLNAAGVREAVCADLAKCDLAVPASLADDLGEHLQDVISDILMTEIAKDPMNVGYAGKTPDEIVELLNSSSRQRAWSGEVFSVAVVTANEEATFLYVDMGKLAPTKAELVGLVVCFADNTQTEYMRGYVASILSHAPTKEILERIVLGGVMPVEVGDTFTINGKPEFGARVSKLFIGVPFAPNAVTVDQIKKVLE